MNSARGATALRTAFLAAAAALVLAGASLNAAGHDGVPFVLAGLAGALAFGAGAEYRSWKLAAALGAASLILTLLVTQFDARQADLALQAPGLALLAAGGVLGALAYRSFHRQLDRQAGELQGLNARLDQKHRARACHGQRGRGQRDGQRGQQRRLHDQKPGAPQSDARGRQRVPRIETAPEEQRANRAADANHAPPCQQQRRRNGGQIQQCQWTQQLHRAVRPD